MMMAFRRAACALVTTTSCTAAPWRTFHCAAVRNDPTRHPATEAHGGDLPETHTRASALSLPISRRFVAVRAERMHLFSTSTTWRQQPMNKSAAPTLATFEAWMCPKAACRAVQAWSTTACGGCGTKRPNLAQWTCNGCSNANHAGVKFCRHCALPYAMPTRWKCAGCDALQDAQLHASGCPACGWQRLVRLAPVVRPAPPEGQTGGPPVATSSSATSETTVGRHPPRTEKRPSSSSTPPQQDATAAAAVVLPPPSSSPPGFAWMCRNQKCGTLNLPTTAACVACEAPLSTDNWTCLACAAVNFKLRTQCFSCHAPIPASWLCVACRNSTSVYDLSCRSCQAPRPEIAPRAHPQQGKTRGDIAPNRSNGPSRGGGDWVCAVCFKSNFAKRSSCYSCDSPRGAGAADDGASDASEQAVDNARDGDWTDQLTKTTPPLGARSSESNWSCRACRSANFRTRKDCWNCGAASPAFLARSPTQSIARAAATTEPGFGESGGASTATAAAVSATAEKAQHDAAGAAAAGGDDDASLLPRIEKEGFQPVTAATSSGGAAASNPMSGYKLVNAQAASVLGDDVDWVCSKCLHRNYRTQQDCFRCFAPKSVLAVSTAGPKTFTSPRRTVKI